VFENRVLRRIFGPKRDEMTAGSRKVHNEGLHNLYSWPSRIRMMRLAGMSMNGSQQKCIQYFGGRHRIKDINRKRKR
jgi:hypothetical protein